MMELFAEGDCASIIKTRREWLQCKLGTSTNILRTARLLADVWISGIRKGDFHGDWRLHRGKGQLLSVKFASTVTCAAEHAGEYLGKLIII